MYRGADRPMLCWPFPDTVSSVYLTKQQCFLRVPFAHLKEIISGKNPEWLPSLGHSDTHCLLSALTQFMSYLWPKTSLLAGTSPWIHMAKKSPSSKDMIHFHCDPNLDYPNVKDNLTCPLGGRCIIFQFFTAGDHGPWNATLRMPYGWVWLYSCLAHKQLIQHSE